MNNNDFLPQDYVAPKVIGDYMRLEDGDNKFRILSRPIIGWEVWKNKKPVRFTFDKKPTAQELVALDPDQKQEPRHFWSMIVWSYRNKKIQILHIIQSGIKKSIQTLSADPDWGSPYFYDIKIIKTGKNQDTKYNVNPLPHNILDESIKKAFLNKPCKLEALFEGADPFATTIHDCTPGVFMEEKRAIEHS